MPSTKNIKQFLQTFSACVFLTMLPWNTFSQLGCTDPQANNYDPLAVQNNGTCTYQNITIVPTQTSVLSSQLNETSGLLIWNNSLITHNDDTDQQLYVLNDTNGTVQSTYDLSAISNIDWEDMTQDQDYFYIGDFGNNQAGNRQDLSIYKIDKSSFGSGSITIDTIYFTYEDQTDFSGTTSNNTDFDCEAMISRGDSLYLFTKEWVSEGSSIYVLSKDPGNQIGRLAAHKNQLGLISGATATQGDSVVILCGYEFPGNPFLYLLYDFPESNFFQGNVRKINLNAQYHQVEAIASTNGLELFLTNEKLTQFTINIEPKLMKIDLEEFIGPYFDYSITAGQKELHLSELNVFPNPFTEHLNLQGMTNGTSITISTIEGKQIWSGSYEFSPIDLSFIPSGSYILQVSDYKQNIIKINN